MPRKPKQIYENYDAIKQSFLLERLKTDFTTISKLGDSDKYDAYIGEAIEATQATLPTGKDKIHKLQFTDTAVTEDQTALIKKGRNLVKEFGSAVKNYNGLFSKTLKADYRMSSQQKGDMLDAMVESPSLEALIYSPTFGPYLLSRKDVPSKSIPGRTESKMVIDQEDLAKKKAYLGPFYDYLEDYYEAAADMVEVIYDRQDAEKTGEPGLNSIYINKYTAAIDKLVDKYAVLEQKAKERYADNTLTREQKGLRYNTEHQSVLNNTIHELTDADPDDYDRNFVPSSVAYYRGESQALKNGWTLNDCGVLGCIEQTIAESEQYLKKFRFIKSQKEKSIDDLRNHPGQDKEADEEQIAEYTNSIRQLDEQIHVLEETADKARAMHDKYYDMKKITYAERQDAIAEFKALHDEYASKFEESKSIRSFRAISEKVLDPYGYNEMDLKSQAKEMLNSLESVTKLFHSSSNFDTLKASVEKLAKLAEQYNENMTPEQWKKYESQAFIVYSNIKTYLNGKNKENTDYKAKHNNRELKRSGYTANRINAVQTLTDKLRAHVTMASRDFTNEYTGTAAERCEAYYDRASRALEQSRINAMNADKVNVALSSTYKSIYIEIMMEKLKCDPAFTERDFNRYMSSEKISNGARILEESLGLDFKERLTRDLISRKPDEAHLGIDENNHEGFEDDNDIPDGLGRDWVKAEFEIVSRIMIIPKPEELIKPKAAEASNAKSGNLQPKQAGNAAEKPQPQNVIKPH